MSHKRFQQFQEVFEEVYKDSDPIFVKIKRKIMELLRSS